MLANEGWLPSERIQINKHHGWRASKHSRMAGRISGSDSERVLKAANRRFCAFFRPLTSNHRGGHRSPVIRKEADSRGRPSHRIRIPTDPKACLPHAGHQSDDVRFRLSGRQSIANRLAFINKVRLRARISHEPDMCATTRVSKPDAG